MKYNMKEWIKGMKGAGVKKALPVLSFPCVSLLSVTVSELIEFRLGGAEENEIYRGLATTEP